MSTRDLVVRVAEFEKEATEEEESKASDAHLSFFVQLPLLIPFLPLPPTSLPVSAFSSPLSTVAVTYSPYPTPLTA